jgi:hypothetical protein
MSYASIAAYNNPIQKAWFGNISGNCLTKSIKTTSKNKIINCHPNNSVSKKNPKWIPNKVGKE